MIFFLLFVVVDAIGGAFYAREAFTEAMTSVINSQASNALAVSSAPVPVFDTSACMTGVLDDKPMNVNRCHSEQMWAREQPSTPYLQPAPPIPTMTKDESSHTALLFGAAMLAGLFALGAAGAGAMWFLRE
jgi:hypothetical protein